MSLPGRLLSPALGLIRVPGLLIGALNDIRTMAVATSELPKVSENLIAIEAAVGSLDDEVTRMRHKVDEIHVEVVGVGKSTGPLPGKFEGVQDAVDPLAEELKGVRQAVHRLEPHLDEVRRAVGPLQGTAERLGQLTNRFPGNRRSNSN